MEWMLLGILASATTGMPIDTSNNNTASIASEIKQGVWGALVAPYTLVRHPIHSTNDMSHSLIHPRQSLHSLQREVSNHPIRFLRYLIVFYTLELN
jgi:hypothetical protein